MAKSINVSGRMSVGRFEEEFEKTRNKMRLIYRMPVEVNWKGQILRYNNGCWGKKNNTR